MKATLRCEKLEDRCTPAFFAVNSTSDDANSGDADVGDGFAQDSMGRTTLRAAIEEANDHAAIDIINFNLVLNPTIALTRKLPNIAGHLVIHYIPIVMGEDGAPASALTITRAANAADFRIFTKILSSVDLTLENLMLRGGKAVNGNGVGDGYGGAIYNGGGNLNVQGCYIIDNRSDQSGGAIYSKNGAHVELYHTTFAFNIAARDGGALYLDPGPSSGDHRYGLIDDCVFQFNRALNGGAIFSKMLLTISNSLFDQNLASTSGGALALRERADITDSTFTSNTAAVNGGGLLIMHATDSTTLTNCIVSCNSATLLGGGIYVGDNHIGLFNVNVVGNTNFGPQPAAGVAIETGPQPPPPNPPTNWWYFGWLTPGSQAVVNV